MVFFPPFKVLQNVLLYNKKVNLYKKEEIFCWKKIQNNDKGVY